jgi:hypothetical protein
MAFGLARPASSNFQRRYVAVRDRSRPVLVPASSVR